MKNAEIPIKRNVLAKNDEAAAELREMFASRGVLALNLLSSPGAGKTTLLENTVGRLGLRAAVVVGDVQTQRDADRISACGVPAIQIVTNGACHLDAAMVTNALAGLDLARIDVLFIENVGNLVCPASFDLGEDLTVVLVSVPEGDDKPAKYPKAFRIADLAVVTKTDLIPHTNFSLHRLRRDARLVNSDLEFIELSCSAGSGLQDWYQWLRTKAEQKRRAAR